MNLSLVRRLAQKLSDLTTAIHASSKYADSSLARALEVAVIGAPNVGKSLLTNQLVRAAVSSVSSKMDTTTQNIEAVLTEDNVQLVVCDSPGTIGLRHAKETMGRSQDDIILTGPELALQRAEHVLVVQNPQQICIDSVRAALLDTTPSNVAYKLKPKISEWKEEGEVLQIVVEINCDKERIGRLLVGKGGRRIAEIGKHVNDHMHSLFARQLFVRILVKCNGKIVDLLSS
ncbi:hypothetical protein OESDEN_07916 [Oesophagostomum dentatum]|uniref:G domain-containing protein n=1 Tax=Oesophagostomum dentatum TaxID=61180 RepID=A0A0B1TA22_OESDE|nr:hypothetical protein OESDEN_07916 [Oesophagostomum dentatum]